MALFAPAPPTAVLPSTSLRALRGPNLWSDRAVLEARIDTSEFQFADWQLADLLFDSQGAAGVPGSVATEPAAWLSAAAVQIQAELDCAVEFHSWSRTATPQVDRLAFEFDDEILGRAAFDLA